MSNPCEPPISTRVDRRLDLLKKKIWFLTFERRGHKGFTYFPVWKPAEYHAFKSTVRSVSQLVF